MSGVRGVRGTDWQALASRMDGNRWEWMAKSGKVQSTWQGVPQTDGHLRFDEQGPSDGISLPAWPRPKGRLRPCSIKYGVLFLLKCPGDFVGSALMAASEQWLARNVGFLSRQSKRLSSTTVLRFRRTS